MQASGRPEVSYFRSLSHNLLKNNNVMFFPFYSRGYAPATRGNPWTPRGAFRANLAKESIPSAC